METLTIKELLSVCMQEKLYVHYREGNTAYLHCMEERTFRKTLTLTK